MDRLKCRNHAMIIAMMQFELQESRKDDRIISPLRGCVALGNLFSIIVTSLRD